MAIKMLSPEQVRSMTLEEKDEWWLRNVYCGNTPQLTLRSALTGMLLGSVLSLTNLYIAARTGWLLGVGITSVVLAFAAWKVLAKVGLGREMSVLENNAMQSIATSAGYMTAPLVSSLAAYTMLTGRFVPMHVAFLWMLCLAGLGILFAFPMKKRFINDEQLPFPEGMATGVILDSLHRSDAKDGLLKAKILIGGGLLSCLIELLRSDKIMRVVAATKAIPAYVDEIIYKLGLKPSILGTSLADLTIRWDTSVIFIATGGLTGIRVGASMLLGAALNYAVLAPILIQRGIITPGESGSVGYEEIARWASWGGVACLTTAALYAFFSRPAVLTGAFRTLFGKSRGRQSDVLAHIELPVRLSIIGVPILGVLLAIICNVWLDVPIVMGLISVPLVFIFSLIAVNSTALTSITPTAALANLTQLFFGVAAPGKIATNIVTAGIASEVSAHASNLLMDIKPGYMLGAKPRLQAIAHFLGAIAGLAVAVPIWYLVIIAGDVNRLGTEALPLPAAVGWKRVSELLMNGLSSLHPTAQAAMIVGAIAGILMEASRQITKDKFPLSAIGFGLAFLLPFTNVLSIFLGGLIFWLIERRVGQHGRGAQAGTEPAAENAPPAKLSVDEAGPPAATAAAEDTGSEAGAGGEGGEGSSARAEGQAPKGKEGWLAIAHDNKEMICAGVIAGGSLTGISLMIATLWLPDVLEAQSIAPSITQAVSALRALKGE
jgi:putative OPT family oligopeptide transporter